MQLSREKERFYNKFQVTLFVVNGYRFGKKTRKNIKYLKALCKIYLFTRLFYFLEFYRNNKNRYINNICLLTEKQSFVLIIL